jgi:ABC-type transport system substrate-binding protein
MRTHLSEFLVAIAAGASLSTGASAQSNTAPQQPPCSGEEYRQLDFWVGNWHAEWDNADGTIGTGENRITRGEYGDCVIYERFIAYDFPGAGRIHGMSISNYLAATDNWRQTWVDDQGGYFSLTGGPVEGEDHIFALHNERFTEAYPHLRMIWEDVTEDAFTWRWQGRASEDEDWADRWVIRYTRMAE